MGCNKFTRDEAIQLIMWEISQLRKGGKINELLANIVSRTISERMLFKKPFISSHDFFLIKLTEDLGLFLNSVKGDSSSDEQLWKFLDSFFVRGKGNLYFREYPVLIPFAAFSLPTLIISIVNLINSVL